MILKKAMIAVGVMGLMYGGNLLSAAALLTTLYCSDYAYCTNSSYCEMGGDIMNYMELSTARVYNNATLIPFWNAWSVNIADGTASCSYVGWTGGPDTTNVAEFFGNGKTRFFPIINNKTNWKNQNGDISCMGNKKINTGADNCPFTTTPPKLRN